LKILILVSAIKNLSELQKKFGHNLQSKLEHLKKLVKKIAILIYPPFGIFLFFVFCIVTKYSKKVFFEKL
jgi:hypothetical protein